MKNHPRTRRVLRFVFAATLGASAGIAGCGTFKYGRSTDPSARTVEGGARLLLPRSGYMGSANPSTLASAVPGTFEEGARLEWERSAGLDRSDSKPTEVGLSIEDVTREAAARRFIAYTADFHISVRDAHVAVERTKEIAQSLGGYVREIDGARITVRIPLDQYETALQRVEALGQVMNRKLQALDVTEEHIDLEARLKNAYHVRERLLELLRQTKTVQETLEVEKELNRVNESIERMEAQLDLLKDRVAYGALSVQFNGLTGFPHEPIRQELPFDWLDQLDPKRLWY